MKMNKKIIAITTTLILIGVIGIIYYENKELPPDPYSNYWLTHSAYFTPSGNYMYCIQHRTWDVDPTHEIFNYVDQSLLFNGHYVWGSTIEYEGSYQIGV